jgi:ADP-ribose pyrophosphatase YjhB (NUDIX family)
VREVHEETRFEVEVTGLIGVYAAPYKDDLVLFFECSIDSQEEWRPDDEIAEVAFMPAPCVARRPLPTDEAASFGHIRGHARRGARLRRRDLDGAIAGRRHAPDGSSPT